MTTDIDNIKAKKCPTNLKKQHHLAAAAPFLFSKPSLKQQQEKK